MRFQSTLLAVAASLAVVSAQLNNIPACALPCLVAATQGSGCSTSDYKCQCTTGNAKITQSLEQCVPGKCSADDQAKLIAASNNICLSAGVTLSSVVPSATSAAASAASSASAAGASAASSASAAISSAPQKTNAAAANAAGVGAVALGFAAAFL